MSRGDCSGSLGCSLKAVSFCAPYNGCSTHLGSQPEQLCQEYCIGQHYRGMKNLPGEIGSRVPNDAHQPRAGQTWIRNL